MWGSLLAGILARPWARRAAGFALAALTIALFLLNLRRSGERAGRAAERLDNLERTMPFTARCWTRPQTALAIATLLLTGCAGVGSDGPARRLSAGGGRTAGPSRRAWQTRWRAAGGR